MSAVRRRGRSAGSKDEVHPCKNAHLGCKVFVKDQDLEEHLKKCNFIFINCDACGQRVLFRDLYTHQKYKKCYENKLRQEVVRNVRKSYAEVRTHQRQLMAETAHREMMKKWAFRIRAHEKVGYTPRVPTALQCLDRQESLRDDRSENPSRLSRNSTLRTNSGDPGKGNTFITGLDYPDERQTRTGTALTFTSSRPRSTDGNDDIYDDSDDDMKLPAEFDRRRPIQCQRCPKVYVESSNHSKACMWHKGPMLQVFGGICQSCGRLDHQKGCVSSYHQAQIFGEF